MHPCLTEKNYTLNQFYLERVYRSTSFREDEFTYLSTSWPDLAKIRDDLRTSWLESRRTPYPSLWKCLKLMCLGDMKLKRNGRLNDWPSCTWIDLDTVGIWFPHTVIITWISWNYLKPIVANILTDGRRTDIQPWQNLNIS